MDDKRKLTDDELENVAGGKSDSFKPCVLYCAGLVARNGNVIEPGCGLEENFPALEPATVKKDMIYRGRCPVCKMPLDIREV